MGEYDAYWSQTWQGDFSNSGPFNKLEMEGLHERSAETGRIQASGLQENHPGFSEYLAPNYIQKTVSLPPLQRFPAKKIRLSKISLVPIITAHFAGNGNVWAGAWQIFVSEIYSVNYTVKSKKGVTLNKTCYRALSMLVESGVLAESFRSSTLEPSLDGGGRKYYRLIVSNLLQQKSRIDSSDP